MLQPGTRSADAVALAAQAARRNRWQALLARRRPLLVAGLLGVLALAGVGLLLLTNAAGIAALLARAIDYPLMVIVAIGWPVANAVARQRRSARRDAQQSWLAALPLATMAFERLARRRVVLRCSLLVVVMTGLVLAVAALVALPARVTGTAILLVASAGLLGAGLGWSLGGRDPRPPRLRLPAAGAIRRDARFRLGYWPLRHSRAHADIGLHARAIGALLLSLPIGTPGIAALCVIVIGLMAFTLRDVLLALLATAAQAGGWVRSLPLQPGPATRRWAAPSIGVLFAAASLLAIALLPAGIAPRLLMVAVIGVVAAALIAVVLACAWHRPFGACR